VKRLDGKVAWVTGAGSGIGEAAALGLARAGASVVLTGRRSAPLEEVARRIKGEGGAAAVKPGDLMLPATARRIADAVKQEFGRLDILVNNAGMSIRKAPQDYAIAEWQAVLDTNLTGAFACAQAVYPVMKQQGGGKIINIGSMYAIFGAAYAAAYAASKGGLVQMTKSLANAWAKDNIQVNTVLPGWIDTELTQAARRQMEGLHDRVLRRTPAGRWGVPEDLAGIAVFLSAPASDFVTGASVPVDGGFSVEF
jgi:2-dehydro-3-deoxy-D-gluconate 5-dehydrogenase